MSTLSPSKHNGMIRIRFIQLYCLVIVVDNDKSVFGLPSPFLHKFVAFKFNSHPITILLLNLNSSINSRSPSIQNSQILAFDVLFGLVRQAEKPKQVLKVCQKFVVLLMLHNCICQYIASHSTRRTERKLYLNTIHEIFQLSQNSHST